MPVGLAIDGANRHDCRMIKATIKSIPVKRPKPTQRKKHRMCLDKGYDFDQVRDLVNEFGYTAHIRSRGQEAQAIKRRAGFRARRWVVERTHSWMNRFRRILTRWEKKAENYLALLHLVCAVITFSLCRNYVQLLRLIRIGSKATLAIAPDESGEKSTAYDIGVVIRSTNRAACHFERRPR